MLTIQTGIREIGGLRFSADGRYLALTDAEPDDDEMCGVWDLTSGTKLVRFASPMDLHGMAWHPKKPELYVPDGFAVDVLAPDGNVLKSYSEMGYIRAIAFSPKGDWMVCSSPFDLVARRWEKKRWSEIWSAKNPTRLKRIADTFDYVVLFPDGRTLATLVHRQSEADGTTDWGTRLVQRDLTTGKVLAERPLSESEAPWGVRNRLAVTPDGAAIVGYRGRSVYVWPTATTQRPRKLTVAKKDLWDVALHPSGRWVATVCNNSEVSICDLNAGKVVQVFDWGIKNLQCVTFSPDGSLAAAGGAKGEVAVWDWDD